MNRPTTDPFCPIYQEAQQTTPWKNAASAHAGLLFDKFADAWRFKPNRQGDAFLELEFDKGVGSRKDGANDWINGFKRAVGNKEMLDETCRRQRQLVQKLGGLIINLTNTDRFVTGMGREHPLENGFAWHHTLGVPYLPGSSVKGLLRGWLREELGEITKDRRGNDAWDEMPEIKQQFGTLGRAGHLILLDMLPTKPPQLDVDVMTPHYGPYYQDRDGKTPPGDWHSPVPISFLTVAPEQKWQLAIVPGQGKRSLDSSTLNSLKDALLEALQFNGAGAKTAVGYGRFEHDVAAQKALEAAVAAEKARLENARAKARAAAEFDASLVGDSEELKQLKKMQRAQSWTASAGDTTMTSALRAFVDQNPTLPQDCIDWVRMWLESIQNYKGVWSNPDEKTGKRKDKWKFSSAVIRDLVRKLQEKGKE